MTEEVKKVEDVPYQVLVQVEFLVKRPKEVDMPTFQKRLWSEMPANNIGNNLFIKFPTYAFNFNVDVQARRVEDAVPDAITVESIVVES